MFYIVVPRFVPILAPLGNDLPMSTRVLLAIYPWAFLVPVVSVGSLLLLPRTSQGVWFVVFGTYIVAALAVIFIFWALYTPMYDLAAARP